MMEPFYSAPQDFDIFSDPELLGALGENFGQIEDLPPELIAQVAQQDLSWQQQLARSAAGGLFPQSSQADMDIAFPAGKRALGQALMAVALAKDKRGQAAALAQAIPHAQDAFRRELGGVMEARQKSEDRNYALERRNFEREGMKETSDDRAREGSSRTARIGSAAAIRSAFELAMQDDDVVKSGKAGALSSAFESAMAELEVSGSAEALKAVRELANAAATLASKSEDFNLGLSQAQQESAVKGGFSTVEEWMQREAKEREDADRRGGLSEQATRASIEGSGLSNEAKRLDLEVMKSGAGLPEGFVRLPNGDIRKDPTYSTRAPSDQRLGLLKPILANDDVQLWLAGKGELPLDAAIILSGMGIESPDDVKAVIKEVTSASGSTKGSGSEGPGKSKVVPLSEVVRAGKLKGLNQTQAVEFFKANYSDMTIDESK